MQQVESKRLHLIACNVFTREVCAAIARSRHVIDVDFTERAAHNDPDCLRNMLQEKIDACDTKKPPYDAVLLCYGLCGNATAGLSARAIPLVIPRAHDCATLFLGSRKKFVEVFGNRLSSRFYAAGYMERGENDDAAPSRDYMKRMGFGTTYRDYVAQYGEENAKYIWETLHASEHRLDEEAEVFYIEVPETAFLGYAERCRVRAEKEGKNFVFLDGSMRLIERLAAGDWNADEFLVVPPRMRIKGVYDFDEIVGCEAAFDSNRRKII